MGDCAYWQDSSRSPNQEIFPKWHSRGHFLSNKLIKFVCFPYFCDVHVSLAGDREVLSLPGLECICVFSDQQIYGQITVQHNCIFSVIIRKLHVSVTFGHHRAFVYPFFNQKPDYCLRGPKCVVYLQ